MVPILYVSVLVVFRLTGKCTCIGPGLGRSNLLAYTYQFARLRRIGRYWWIEQGLTSLSRCFVCVLIFGSSVLKRRLSLLRNPPRERIHWKDGTWGGWGRPPTEGRETRGSATGNGNHDRYIVGAHGKRCVCGKQ